MAKQKNETTAVAEQPGIEIKDVGPIERLHIPLPEEGGVVVLRGRNGVGKSHALDSAARLLGDSGTKPPSRDGKRKGVVDGLGVRINVASRITQSGELECDSLEGRFDLSRLVDPGVADEVSADNKRIKALLRLGEWEGSVDAFQELVGGQEAYEELAIEHTDDVVLLASRVKRALEKRARDKEKRVEELENRAFVLHEQAGDPDDETDRDIERLNSELEEAIMAKAQLHEQAAEIQRIIKRREDAEQRLAKLPNARVQPEQQAVDDLAEQRAGNDSEIEAVEQRLKHLQDRGQQLKQQHEAALERLSSEIQRQQDRNAFEKILASETPEPIKEIRLDESVKQVARIRELIGQAQAAIKRDDLREESQAVRNAAKLERREAVKLRDAAQATDEVLSTAVASLGVDLKVVDGRLCVESDRGDEPYAELSHGERWKLAIDIGVERVGKRGLLAISQEGWEGLDPMARQSIVEHARKRGVVILTAECDGGELRAETE